MTTCWEGIGNFRALAQILLAKAGGLTRRSRESADTLGAGMRRVRPRFQLECAAPPDQVIRYIGQLLRHPGCPVSGLACPGRIELHVHGNEQHLWSPQLIVDLQESPRGTELSARFGPHPSVWTMYVAGYAACGFGMLMGASFAYAEWVMGSPPWLLLSIPASLLAALGLYLLAFFGQEAGAEQMKRLRKFLKKALRNLDSSSAAEVG